jgi:O-antigen/teichoic acid export membrane protein
MVTSLVRRHSLLRNSIYIMLTTAVNSGLGYLFWIVVAHSYAPKQVGVAAALVAAMTFIAAVANFGTSSALIQRLPRAPDDADWSRTLSTSIAVGGVAGFLFALLSATVILPAAGHSLAVVDANLGYVMLFAVGVAVWSVALISDYLFIAERRSENMVIRNFAFGVFKLAIVAAMPLILAATALGIFGSWIAGCALSLLFAYLVMLPRLHHRFQFVIRGTLSAFRSMVRSYAGNYLTTLGNVIPFALLPVFVVARLSATDNAYFYVTWLLGGAFFTISSAIGSALFAEGAHDAEAVHTLTRSAVKVTAAMLAPVMLLFFVGGRELLTLFGTSYARHGGALLIVLTASAVPDAVTNLYIAKLRAQGRLGFPAATNMAMAAITLGGAWLLLRPLGLVGAGWAWLAAQIVGSLAVLLDIRSRRRTGRPPTHDAVPELSTFAQR